MQGKYFNEKIETMPQEQMRKLQSERLINTVNRVYKNVPAYRNACRRQELHPMILKAQMI
jgi:phenylacetate-CoA ligase